VSTTSTSSSAFDTTLGNFSQPVLEVVDSTRFATVRNAIEAAFAPAQVERFFKSLGKSGIRIRHFESVLGAGLLGASAHDAYKALVNSYQGQIREIYLASLERVAPEVRKKFFRLYAYY
jgi:hypothetical protein